jgi:lactoylglutathione lyase
MAPSPESAPAAAVVADHIALHVADPSASVALYATLFGFEETPLANTTTRWLGIGNGVELHLIAGRTAPVSTPREVHLAFRSSGLEPTVARLDAQGVQWTNWNSAARTINAGRRDGVHQVVVRDPEGYMIDVNDAAALGRQRP